MISFIFALFLNKVAMIGLPLILLGVAVLLFIRGMTHIAMVVGIVAGGLFAGGLVYQEGVKACETRVAKAVAEEKARQARVNAEAVAESTAIANDLRERVRQLEQQRMRDDEAADNDAGANSCGLGADSMRRLQTIGPRRR